MRILLLLLTTTLAFGATADRIVSTAPSITETLFALGLGPRVVGVTIYCRYPPAALKVPKIGSYLHPDVEMIVALHPDLVVVQKVSNRLTEQLKPFHIRSLEVESDNLDGVYKGALEIGKASGTQSKAEELVRHIKEDLRQVQSKAAKLSKPTAVFLVGHTAGKLEGLVAGAGGSYFSDLLSIAGATNVFEDAKAPYPTVPFEEILSRNPDFILEMSGESRSSQDEVLRLWRDRKSLRAVANHHVYAVPDGPFIVPGPRAPSAARLLLQLIHPEARL